jgi:hypothetical protein
MHSSLPFLLPTGTVSAILSLAIRGWRLSIRVTSAKGHILGIRPGSHGTRGRRVSSALPRSTDAPWRIPTRVGRVFSG